jgi:hypothetical protein
MNYLCGILPGTIIIVQLRIQHIGRSPPIAIEDGHSARLSMRRWVGTHGTVRVTVTGGPKNTTAVQFAVDPHTHTHTCQSIDWTVQTLIMVTHHGHSSWS